MGPTRRAVTTLVCLLLVTQSASFGPVNAAATPGSHPAGEVAADSAPRSPATEEPAPLAVQTTFDNFNRTVAAGWGVSSSGVGWNSNTSVQGLCPSYSTSVDGQVGKIARINTGSCIPFMAASAGNGPWKQLPAWTFTGRFRAPPTLLPAEGGLLIGIRRRAISRSLRAADNVIEEVLPRGDLVIGKMDDLAQATGWRVGDYTLNLPPLPPAQGVGSRTAHDCRRPLTKACRSETSRLR